MEEPWDKAGRLVLEHGATLAPLAMGQNSEQWVKDSGLKDREGKEDRPLCMTSGHRQDSHAYYPWVRVSPTYCHQIYRNHMWIRSFSASSAVRTWRHAFISGTDSSFDCVFRILYQLLWHWLFYYIPVLLTKNSPWESRKKKPALTIKSIVVFQLAFSFAYACESFLLSFFTNARVTSCPSQMEMHLYLPCSLCFPRLHRIHQQQPGQADMQEKRVSEWQTRLIGVDHVAEHYTLSKLTCEDFGRFIDSFN